MSASNSRSSNDLEFRAFEFPQSLFAEFWVELLSKSKSVLQYSACGASTRKPNPFQDGSQPIVNFFTICAQVKKSRKKFMRHFFVFKIEYFWRTFITLTSQQVYIAPVRYYEKILKKRKPSQTLSVRKGLSYTNHFTGRNCLNLRRGRPLWNRSRFHV